MDIYRFAKRVAVAGLVLLLLVGGLYLIIKHFYFFLLVFAGVLMAVMFSGLTNWLTRKTHMNRGLSLFLVTVFVFGIIIGSFWLIAPSVSQQFAQMQKTVPQSLTQVEEWLSQYSWGEKVLQKVPGDLSKIVPKQKSILSNVTGALSSTVSFLADLLIVIVTALFLAASPKLYKNGFAELFPVKHRNRVQDVLDKCYHTLKMWLLGMLLSMVIVGVSAAIAYKLLGLNMAFALALLAFFFEFVPNIGPWVAGIPAVLIGLTQSPQLALYVALVYSGIQFIESFLIIPVVMKRTVDLPPALLLFFQVLLGIVQGALGLLLAAPLLAVIMVVVKEAYVKDVLERKAHAGQTGVS